MTKKTITDETLGKLRQTAMLTKTNLEYTTHYMLDGKKIEFILYTDEESGELEDTLRHAKVLINKFSTAKKKIERYLKKEVYPGVKKHCDSKLSFTDFVQELKLDCICIHSAGERTYMFNAGDVFSGHDLWLIGDASGNITDFDTPG